MQQETTRPAWRTRYLERQAREREVRRADRDRYLAQAAETPTSSCAKCRRELPLDCFVLLKSGVKAGQRKPRCKSCLTEDARAAYKRKSPPRPSTPDGTRQCTGCQEVLPIERFALNRSRPKAGTRRARCKACRGAEARAAYTPRTGLRQERERKATERAAKLFHLLSGGDPLQRIATEEEWQMAAAELRRLWLLSGDKQCITCRATVPPAAMLPPGPGNFYSGNCQSCAHDLYHKNRAEAGCGEIESCRRLVLSDGSEITLAQLAQRYAERLASRQLRRHRVG